MTSLESLIAYADRKLAKLETAGQRRKLEETLRYTSAKTERSNNHLISFCDNDYLSLACDPRMAEAAADAAYRYGVGAGASRLVTGNHPLNSQLEKRLAGLKKMEAARLFGSGYLANIGTIPCLVGPGDTVIMDELSHACMYAGAQLSGADIRLFRHNDVSDAARYLDTARGQVLVLTETVFSMDGDLAPLAALSELCEVRAAWLMTDDAHGFGVCPLSNPAHIQMGTLSKAAGVYGGYVCGPQSLIELLISRSRSFVYTTGLPPPVLAAILRALDIMEAEPERSERAQANARLFAREMGLPIPPSVIVPVIIGAEHDAMQASAALMEKGYLVTAIRPPTVPAGTARLRITFCAGHTEEDVRGLARAVSEITERLCLPTM